MACVIARPLATAARSSWRQSCVAVCATGALTARREAKTKIWTTLSESRAQRRSIERHHRIEMQPARFLQGKRGAQTMPDVWRITNAIFSDVHRLAATNRAPSLSRSSSSATMTSSPRRHRRADSTPRSKDKNMDDAQQRIRSAIGAFATHRSLDKDAPFSRPVQRAGSIHSHAILGGLHHHYVRV